MESEPKMVITKERFLEETLPHFKNVTDVKAGIIMMWDAKSTGKKPLAISSVYTDEEGDIAYNDMLKTVQIMLTQLKKDIKEINEKK